MNLTKNARAVSISYQDKHGYRAQFTLTSTSDELDAVFDPYKEEDLETMKCIIETETQKYEEENKRI